MCNLLLRIGHSYQAAGIIMMFLIVFARDMSSLKGVVGVVVVVAAAKNCIVSTYW